MTKANLVALYSEMKTGRKAVPGKVTMEDIAREAGCSRPQVSRAFNGKPNVAPEVRERVLAAAKRLNYRNTANRHQIRIAVIVQSIGGSYTQMVLNALLENACKRNWVCHIMHEQFLHTVSDYFYDGVISLIFNDSWARKWVEERTTPLVMVNSYGTAFDKICSIDPDSYEGSCLVLRHLKQLGHRKIARVHFVSPEQVTYHRGQSEFLKAAAEFNLGDSVRNFQFVGLNTLESALLSVLEQGFTAVYMIHQNLAVPAARVILDAGYRIPDDVSLVTYELPEISCHLSPPHTTLDFDYDALARRALEELRLRMLGRATGGGSVLIPNILIVRGSTGPCRRKKILRS